MLNGIFVFIVLFSILLAALSGNMKELTDAVLQDSRKAVDLSLKLIGVMAFFLGLMKVAEEKGWPRRSEKSRSPPTDADRKRTGGNRMGDRLEVCPRHL